MTDTPKQSAERDEFLETLQHEFEALDPGNSMALESRKALYLEFFTRQYSLFRSKTAKELLVSRSAETINSKHSRWMDSWIRFTWTFAVAEERSLMVEYKRSAAQKTNYLKSVLPQKKRREAELTALLFDKDGNKTHLDIDIYAYYRRTLKELKAEISELSDELAILQRVVPQLPSKISDEGRLLNLLVIFARGGYGREELTFSSDVDLGYCVDFSTATLLETQTLQELIKRMEELFQTIPLDVASQYFESGEDLSRFTKTSMSHTIPSILEGRGIQGKRSLLRHLKKKFFEICPQEKMIRYLQQQMGQLPHRKSDLFLIKEGYGGIRHLQFALWMVLLIINPQSGNSRFLLGVLRKQSWISKTDEAFLIQALEFFHELRNFRGLINHYEEELSRIGLSNLITDEKANIDFLDDSVSLAYLKLKPRFDSIDGMDRFRLSSTKAVSRLASVIIKEVLDRTVVVNLAGFDIEKHLGSNTIIGCHLHQKRLKSSWNLQQKAAETEENSRFLCESDFFDLFNTLDNLFELFLYIGKTGSELSSRLKDRFARLIPRWAELNLSEFSNEIKRFFYNLFILENGSVAISQLIAISGPLDWDGSVQTVLGLFFPEVNRMRYALRNVEIHQYPLCIHSLKALSQVEAEMVLLQEREPELWRFITEEDVFALKWSTLFHDVGKIDPGRDHEELGPMISTNMLLSIGWNQEDQILGLIHFLISNHQSVVRYSQLSTYLDLGILKFFELAQRDPRKIILLYLINIADFKSVNSEMFKKAAHLEMFFEKSISILENFRQKQSSDSMIEVVNGYLDKKVEEIRVSVLLELLLEQCRNSSLDDTLIRPLERLSSDESQKLNGYREELDEALIYLKQSKQDTTSLERYRLRFIQLVRQSISETNIERLVAPLSKYWGWFFTAVPNRYLLSSTVDILMRQLRQFEDIRYRSVRFSFIRGEPGEHDSILFHCFGDLSVLSKIAYALSWRGINIENGKINKIIYAGNNKGLIGFFKVSQKNRSEKLSNIDLETIINNLEIPPLSPVSSDKEKAPPVQIDFFQEHEKGYIVRELTENQFSREKEAFTAIKISLYDAPFCYYKINRSFEAIGVTAQQVTVTTIGDQIIDYFYVSRKDGERMRRENFGALLQKYINAEIAL